MTCREHMIAKSCRLRTQRQRWACSIAMASDPHILSQHCSCGHTCSVSSSCCASERAALSCTLAQLLMVGVNMVVPRPYQWLRKRLNEEERGWTNKAIVHVDVHLR